MTDVTNKVTTVYVADTRQAVVDTQKLATAQKDGARAATKAYDDFAKDASSALGKIERDHKRLEQSWAKAQKSMEDGGGALTRALDAGKNAADKFNKTVGFINQTFGNVNAAIKLGTLAVEGLGKAWNFLGDALGSKPQLRMMWEESPHKRWMEMWKEKTKAAEDWAAAMAETEFGSQVDSPKSMARRLASREKVKAEREAKGAVGMMRFADYTAGQAKLAEDAEREKAKAWKDMQDLAASLKTRKGGSGGGYEMGGVATGMYNFRLAGSEQIDRTIEAMAAERAALPFTAGAIGDTSASDALAGRYDARSGFDPSSFGSNGLGLAAGSVKTPTILDRMFGNVDEIDGYTRAWSTLEDAVTSGYEALITGSESAGAAIKKVIATSIMAEGSRMLVMALREGAMAVAALATGNFASAAAHGKSAIMFGAGATAAGIAASALGGGASVGGTNPSTLPTGAATARDRDEGTRTHIIIGQGWQDEDTPRQRAHRFAKSAVNSAGYDTSPRGVVYQ